MWTTDWYESRGADPTVKFCCTPSVNARVVTVEKSYNTRKPQFRIFAQSGQPSRCTTAADDRHMKQIGFRRVSEKFLSSQFYFGPNAAAGDMDVSISLPVAGCTRLAADLCT